MPRYRDSLPQLAGEVFLTDSGLETDLIFNRGVDLPEFAAFTLVASDDGRAVLREYYTQHARIARDCGAGFIFEAPTWRSSPDWGEKLGYSPESLVTANRAAVAELVALREECDDGVAALVVSGCIGPRGDGYQPDELLTESEAESYHRAQVETFAQTEADLVTAMTITHTGEAIGIARAAAAAGMPAVISFTVETDGRLPDGTELGAAIVAVDEATSASPAYYMINCAHPTHFGPVLDPGAEWTRRIRGLRANASQMSHAELDEAEQLDDGDPLDLGRQYARLREEFPQINVLGGCCGTDARHVEQIAAACAW